MHLSNDLVDVLFIMASAWIQQIRLPHAGHHCHVLPCRGSCDADNLCVAVTERDLMVVSQFERHHVRPANPYTVVCLSFSLSSVHVCWWRVGHHQTACTPIKAARACCSGSTELHSQELQLHVAELWLSKLKLHIAASACPKRFVYGLIQLHSGDGFICRCTAVRWGLTRRAARRSTEPRSHLQLQRQSRYQNL